MSTKASIIAKIQSLLTGNTSKTDWDDHEEILYNSTDSILESVYSDVIVDNETTTNVFTALNANSEYTIKALKQGRKVTLNIIIKCVSSYIGGDIVGITNTEFHPIDDLSFFDRFADTGSVFQYSSDTGDTLTVSIEKDSFLGFVLSFTSNSNVLFQGQTFRGQLTYFTKD